MCEDPQPLAPSLQVLHVRVPVQAGAHVRERLRVHRAWLFVRICVRVHMHVRLHVRMCVYMCTCTYMRVRVLLCWYWGGEKGRGEGHIFL